MSNRNNLPNRHVNHGDDTNRSSHVLEQPAPPGEPVADERTINPQDLTNERIDRLIVYEPNNHEGTIPAMYWFILLLFGVLVYLCWPLLLFVFIAYQLITYNNPLGANLRETQVLNQNLSPRYIFDPGRDAQAEGRTAHPTQEDLTFSNTVEILDHVRYGIQAAPTPDLITFVDLNIIQHTDVVTNNENNNNDGGEIINPNIENEAIVQIPAIGNNEDDLTNNDQQTARTLLTIQNNVEVNQINTVDGQPATIVPLRNEVAEVEINIATPGDATRQAIIPRIHSAGTLIPKSTNAVRRNSESGIKRSA